jgi:uncharacterized protein YkwD
MDGNRSPHLLRILALALLALVMATPAAQAHLPGCGRFAQTRAAPVPRSDLAILCLVNRTRAMHRIAPLRINPALTSAARRYSATLVADRFFSHVGPGNATLFHRVTATGYLRGARSWALGETLAWANPPQASPTGLVALLMASPPHRVILLDPTYHDIGIGVFDGVPGAGGGATLTLDLGATTR